MQLTNILPILAALGASSASPLVPRGCFPDNTHALVQSSQITIGNLINNIFQQDNTTGKANYIASQKSLDNLKASVRPNSFCNNGAAPVWPTNFSPLDSQVRAIDILRDSQDVLMNLDQDVIECKTAEAQTLFCTARKLVSNIDGYYKS